MFFLDEYIFIMALAFDKRGIKWHLLIAFNAIKLFTATSSQCKLIFRILHCLKDHDHLRSTHLVIKLQQRAQFGGVNLWTIFALRSKIHNFNKGHNSVEPTCERDFQWIYDQNRARNVYYYAICQYNFNLFSILKNPHWLLHYLAS